MRTHRFHMACNAIGHARQSDLENLCDELRNLPELNAKRSIKLAAKFKDPTLSLEARYAMPGDDCAAFKTGDTYQLFAAEGMLPDFVKSDPRAAGWSSVMANVSDIAAMGGRPTAIVNTFWHQDSESAEILLANIKRACDFFGVQFAGGHSSVANHYTPNLAVAIIGQAKNLLSCHHVRAGQRLFILSDLTGSWHGNLPYWGCVPGKTPEQVQQQWAVPARLAEEGVVCAAKDISNGGILGTLIMMLELTGCGATVDLNAIPKPTQNVLRWLRAFQSFGFLLTVEQDKVSALINYFKHSHLSCSPIGTINETGKILLDSAGCTAQFWDLNAQSLTDMGRETNASC